MALDLCVTHFQSKISVSDEIRRLCKQKRLKEALQILQSTNYHNVGLSAYVSLLQGCVNIRALPQGKLVHAHIIQSGIQCEGTFFWNNLLTLYAKCGSLVDGRRVLNQIPNPCVISWTAMITAYTRYEHADDALALLKQMRRTCIKPDHFTFSSILPACTNYSVLKEVHGEIVTSGFQSDVFVGNALVDMYAKCGSLENARYLFDKMPNRNVVSWNAMIAGYVHNGHFEKSLRLFENMPERDDVSWTTMIAGYGQNGNVERALEFFNRMPDRSLVSWNAMITVYAQNGFLDEAMKLFDLIPDRIVAAWNTMIAGYAQNGRWEYALNLFEQMQLESVKPNVMTFSSVLPACASLTALERGKEIHEQINKSGFQSNVFVASALVHMYAKCGSIENARSVFDKMRQRDVVSWTAMIEAYAMHGSAREALELFKRMICSGTKPNQITLVGVLSACCHAGLVDEGWQYFNSMSQCYHIVPTMEHYGCMVDLLGRAGQLDKAEDFIKRMPIKPDVTIWRCLLGACKAHNNVQLGERVAEHLFELDPENASPFLQLANIYAAAGRWDGIQKVRKMMNERQIKKMPGCSWIEVDKMIYSFVVGDTSQSQTENTWGT
ncbi:pentatricopeptide repeat-containing protein At4g02750 [Cryptomeria japonica]|uniref:pentatricopeptide repeat-containing protein At4g02750 n=1 Tax=Cryptomeria japonica TaxID=3369 RepID=UPI0027D9D901|nr:pentatricopeptide repeat-containing protein At4g02750 [Cryptomeria japonica]